jgi:hypothetical protein
MQQTSLLDDRLYYPCRVASRASAIHTKNSGRKAAYTGNASAALAFALPLGLAFVRSSWNILVTLATSILSPANNCSRQLFSWIIVSSLHVLIMLCSLSYLANLRGRGRVAVRGWSRLGIQGQGDPCRKLSCQNLWGYQCGGHIVPSTFAHVLWFSPTV